MHHPSAPEDAAHSHELQCMEIWNGNRLVENLVASSGLNAWISSQPYHGESQGGDVHYLSKCVGGILTRVVLADVAGHGDEVAETSIQLRQLLRKHMNAKKQNRLVSELNRQFTQLESDGRFATAIVASYLSHKSKLLLTNAGHPRPLIHRKSQGGWKYLSEEQIENGEADNLPFGLDGASTYQHYVLKIEADDWLVLYTDAFTEQCDANGCPIGDLGLMSLVEQIPLSYSAAEFGRELRERLLNYSPQYAHDDDATLIVIRFTGEHKAPGLAERLRGYSKVLFPRSAD